MTNRWAVVLISLGGMLADAAPLPLHNLSRSGLQDGKFPTLKEVQTHVVETIGGEDVATRPISAMEKDLLGVASSLQYRADKAPDDQTFRETIDLTDREIFKTPIQLGVLADDNVEVEVTEQTPGSAKQTFETKSGALWKPESFQKSPFILNPGKTYSVTVKYHNEHRWNANGKVDLDGVTVYAFLLPVEIHVKRPQNLSNEWAKSGKVIDNLLSVWDTHDDGKDWIQVKVVLPESFAQNLPPNFIKWTVEGVSTPIADNTLETSKLRWPGQTGVKKITIDFPMARLRKFLYVDLPHVGRLSRDDVISGFQSQGADGYIRLVKILRYSDIATDWSESQTSLKPSERNALKHAAWMSLIASDTDLGAGYAKLVGDGYEFRDKDTNQPASESTMDLHNNEIGRGVVHTDVIGLGDMQLIFQELLQKLEAGELWIWDGNGDEHGLDSLDLIIKSNEQKLYPSEETY